MKEMTSKANRLPRESEEIFHQYISDKRLISMKYHIYTKLNIFLKIPPNVERSYTDISRKKEYSSPISV